MSALAVENYVDNYMSGAVDLSWDWTDKVVSKTYYKVYQNGNLINSTNLDAILAPVINIQGTVSNTYTAPATGTYEVEVAGAAFDHNYVFSYWFP